MSRTTANSRCAVVLCAQGDTFEAYKKNLLFQISRYIKDCDVVDLGISDLPAPISRVPEDERATFARLAIPLMERFDRYDRVVWLDVDVDLLSVCFSRIFDPGVVETSMDGLACVRDVKQEIRLRLLNARLPWYDKLAYFLAGVMVMDMRKIDKVLWRKKIEHGIDEHLNKPFLFKDQDILNAYFDIAEMDVRFNWVWREGVVAERGAWLVHYCDKVGHDYLTDLLKIRSDSGFGIADWRDRCVVVSPRHSFIRSWIRSYFSSDNNIPLIIVPGPPGDWDDADMEYCRAAAEYSGGMVFDCSSEWESGRVLSNRAVRDNVGWYTKRLILHAVATRLHPKSWAWIDDDAQVTGELEECFRYAENAPGFICTEFYYPGEIDIRHPAMAYRSRIDPDDKICWNSLVFFHGEANERIAEDLCKDYPIEDDEIIFCRLYKSNPAWHEGFCDFSIHRWQLACRRVSQIPDKWFGKVLHYTSIKSGMEVKKRWAGMADHLPRAPFEKSMDGLDEADDESIDAVFVIGTESEHDNGELRYALRNMEKHCKFVRNVYICGYCPDWIDKSKVIHLQWPDRFPHAKDSNIIDKLRHACETRGIAKRILFCSDDQFQTRECTWEDFAPRYLRRYQSNDRWYGLRNRAWHTRLMLTLEREVQRRIRMGMEATDVFYYQPHMWMQIDRDRFLEYAKACGYQTRDDTIIASGYFNFIDAKGVLDFDHRFIGSNVDRIDGVTHIAYHDPTYDNAMSYLKVKFPDKSRFEL